MPLNLGVDEKLQESLVTLEGAVVVINGHFFPRGLIDEVCSHGDLQTSFNMRFAAASTEGMPLTQTPRGDVLERDVDASQESALEDLCCRRRIPDLDSKKKTVEVTGFQAELKVLIPNRVKSLFTDSRHSEVVFSLRFQTTLWVRSSHQSNLTVWVVEACDIFGTETDGFFQLNLQ